MERRPGGSTLRSLCDSDILLITQGGKQTAYYLDAEKCQELPADFTDKIYHQNKPGKNKRTHDFER